MQSCVHSIFFFFDPLSREGGRWETKHFIGMALLINFAKISEINLYKILISYITEIKYVTNDTK